MNTTIMKTMMSGHMTLTLMTRGMAAMVLATPTITIRTLQHVIKNADTAESVHIEVEGSYLSTPYVPQVLRQVYADI